MATPDSGSVEGFGEKSCRSITGAVAKGQPTRPGRAGSCRIGCRGRRASVLPWFSTRAWHLLWIS